eukprot:COSAG05_NODE_6058_length_1031_cov_0.840129_1_plen_284_part_01
MGNWAIYRGFVDHAAVGIAFRLGGVTPELIKDVLWRWEPSWNCLWTKVWTLIKAAVSTVAVGFIGVQLDLLLAALAKKSEHEVINVDWKSAKVYFGAFVGLAVLIALDDWEAAAAAAALFSVSEWFAKSAREKSALAIEAAIARIAQGEDFTSDGLSSMRMSSMRMSSMRMSQAGGARLTMRNMDREDRSQIRKLHGILSKAMSFHHTKTVNFWDIGPGSRNVNRCVQGYTVCSALASMAMIGYSISLGSVSGEGHSSNVLMKAAAVLILIGYPRVLHLAKQVP